MNLVPGLSLRVSAAAEDVGIDDSELGEFAYDYVELTRHVADSSLGVVSSTSSTQEKAVSGKP